MTAARLKVAFVNQPWNDVAPPVGNGSVAILAYEAARRLARSCDVTMYARRGAGQAAFERHEGVEYRRVPTTADAWLLRALRRLPRRRANPLVGSGLYYVAYALQVARDIRRRRCDIVQLFNLSQFIPIIRRFNPQAKILIRMSCNWLTQLRRKTVERRLRGCDLVIGCSRYLTDSIAAAFPQFADRCRTVHNGRDVSRFAPQREGRQAGRRLLYVGRVSPEKGLHVLLRALPAVVERFPDARLTIIGPEGEAPHELLFDPAGKAASSGLAALARPSYGKYLRSLAGRELAGRVSFGGFVPHHLLPERYREAAVFVFPSVWPEPSGNPPIEAMAAGVPVVATRTGGTQEYVADGETGLLVQPGDSKALADALIRLLGDDRLRKKMGQAGVRRARALFSADRMAQALLGLYAELAA